MDMPKNFKFLIIEIYTLLLIYADNIKVNYNSLYFLLYINLIDNKLYNWII